MIEKKYLRAEFKKIRDSIQKSVRDTENKKIAENLINSDFYKNAKTVFIYASFGSEVETYDIIKQIIADEKRLAVPRCITKTHTMEAVCIKSTDELICGAYKISEPSENNKNILNPSEIDLVIVPALAFDRKGFRLGYGGGYYDRFLRDFGGASIGLCYAECLVDNLPYEEFDCRVSRIICPEEML